MVEVEVPTCSRCEREAILHQAYSGQDLCSGCLVRSVRKRVGRELRRQLVLPKGEQRPTTTILAAISGGKDSAVLLEMLVHFLSERPDVRIVAGCVDEGIAGYRSPAMKCARRLAESLDIEFEAVAFTEIGFEAMDEVVVRMPEIGKRHSEAAGMSPCSYCGVFRRRGILRLAERVGADVIAMGHNLDDMAQTVLMNMTKGDIERTLRLAPHSWAPLEGLAPRIVPLRWVPEQEVHAFAMTRGLDFHDDECPHSGDALRGRHREMVARMEDAAPGTRHGLVHSSDAIKRMYAENRSAGELSDSLFAEASECERCGELSSQKVCKACIMQEWLSPRHN